MPKFVHLHTHSHYSLLDGLSKIDPLVERVKELGMEAMAVTDHGVLYGAVEFYKKAKKEGLKPILGVEAYVAPRDRFSKESNERYYHLVLLAENEQGWKNLLKLVSKAHTEGFYYKPRMDKELLREHHEGIIALSACLGGEIDQALLAGRFEDAKKIAAEHQDIFGKDNYFLEIQRHSNIGECENVYKEKIKLAKETGIPLVATQDSHYIHKEDAEYHEILLAVQTGNKLADEGRMSMKADDFSITSPEEMAEKFADVPEALENTVKIAERCKVTLDLGVILLPEFPKPEGITRDAYLKQLVEERLPDRFPSEALTKEVRERIDYELDVIVKTGFADYFLIVQDLVNWAKDHGISVGPGRGSAAGSIVSYILKITDLDPLEYGLLFERFLNPERIEMPDIDIDFADTRRDEVLAYAREKYGEDRVAQIITFGTMAARAAVRDAGRAMGLSYSLCDQIAKLIPLMSKLKDALAQVPELKQMYQTSDEARRVLDAAAHLEGVARHASVHACGTVIAKDPLVENVPLQFAPQDKQNIITQFEMHAIGDLGLLKIDLLGLRNLTIIQDAVRLVKDMTGEQMDISKIPLDDPDTFALLQRGDTTGVFQFECLSGDTIVSNTTIKKLYENKNKSVLQSVYVDEGKVHRNKILGIAKSGAKEVYALIAENGWHIKASKDHQFLSENGWKKLSELRPGEKLLMKTKARHLVYNTCRNCGKQIDGQKDGKSEFCYKCSATYYSNPSKVESREAMQVGRSRFFARGGHVWNEGLTIENNEILRETGRKISKALTGVSLAEKVGEERATELKRLLSERSSGANNPMFGKKSPHRKGGVREDLGHYVRSNWEADFARILKLYGVKYEYEPKTFKLVAEDGRILHYTPDFYVKSENTFYEIKGWLHEADQEKMDLFQQQYPEYNFVLINKTKFAELALQYRNLVAWECPRIPTEQSFDFISIKEIRYAGMEETYDIAMEAPGNNFVANGFVVHNSSGMRRYMKDLKPTALEDLIALVSLYRPGPMELIPSFIKRKKGEEQVTYLHPRLQPILSTTYGIGIYQEQMMQIARDLAGYTLPEADTLRKAIGKKIKSLLDEQKEKLTAGMIHNGIDPKIARQIWELFPPFARYGFNKSHAACYALIAYRTAYLKAHYPGEFAASILNAESGDIDRIAFLVSEARQSNIRILPPDVNASFTDFTPEGDEKEHDIRFGLLAIKNVGGQIAAAIIEERAARGPFKDFNDFLARVQHKDLNKKSLEAMGKSGVFDSLGIDRNQMLANLDEITRFHGVVRRGAAAPAANSLFGAAAPVTLAVKLMPAPEATMAQKLAWEKELLGFYLSDHPLNGFADKFKAIKARPFSELRILKNEQLIFRTAGLVSSIKHIVTKSGQPMLFAQLEDFSPKPMEVVVFNSVLERTKEVWQMGNVVVVEGKLSFRDGEPKILCERAQVLEK